MHARGMFRWVQVWLDILLPALDDKNTIRTLDKARGLLGKLQHDVTHNHNAYQLLESGYQRLWDFNDLSEYRKQRIRLFQIVLGAFEPQTVENLREALRIQGRVYDQDLTTAMVERLCSNFLYEDRPQGLTPGLRFVHDSARKFILEMDTRQAGRPGEDNEVQFSERNNHLTIAELYIDVVGLSAHPFWQANEIEPSNWTEMNSNSPKTDRLRQDRQRWIDRPTSFHVYLAMNGLQHCAIAARKRSMFDAVWSKVLDRVILDPGSAFGFIVSVEKNFELHKYSSRNRFLLSFLLPYVNNSCLLGQVEGRVHLLYSHVLALLNIIHEDDVSRLRLAMKKPNGLIEKDDHRRLRCLFKHAACVGGDLTCSQPFFRRAYKATALHLACRTLNRAAVDMMLQYAKCLSDDDANGILFTEFEDFDYPINIAIGNSLTRTRDSVSRFQITETLLKFEKSHSSTISVSNHLNPATEPYISEQWALPCTLLAEPALHPAVRYFEEDRICDLLSVAQPEDINIRDPDGLTVLHLAAGKGFLRLAAELVEKYDADIEAKCEDGWTPAFFAFVYSQDKLLEYFKSRGANVDFTEEDRRLASSEGRKRIETERLKIDQIFRYI